MVCTQHRVFRISKSDSIRPRFTSDAPCFNFQTWRIMSKCCHRIRWLWLDSDSSCASLEEQSPHLHFSCRSLELFREESGIFFFFFPSHYLHHQLYKLGDRISSEYFGSFSSNRCCFALAILKVSTGQLWSRKGNNCCNWQQGKQLLSMDPD